jgi:predicted transcriptional regulator
MQITKRHLLLLCRSAITPDAKITLLEILLHLAAKKKTPSLNQLARKRGRVRASMQNHIDELTKAGILKKLRHVGTNTIDYEFSEDALAEDCGFDEFASVEFETLLMQEYAGAVSRDVQHGKTTVKELSKVNAVLVKEEGKLTERDLLLMFSTMHYSIFGSKYSTEKKDWNQLRTLRAQYGSGRVADMITDFLTHRNLHRNVPSTIAGLWERRQSLEKRTNGRSNNSPASSGGHL